MTEPNPTNNTEKKCEHGFHACSAEIWLDETGYAHVTYHGTMTREYLFYLMGHLLEHGVEKRN